MGVAFSSKLRNSRKTFGKIKAKFDESVSVKGLCSLYKPDHLTTKIKMLLSQIMITLGKTK